MQLRESQSIIGMRDLERMSSELVRLCDSVEKHGLVDYQMGVAEEEIMDCEFLIIHDSVRASNICDSTTALHCASDSGSRKG